MLAQCAPQVSPYAAAETQRIVAKSGSKGSCKCDMGLHGDIIDPQTCQLASRRSLSIDMELVDIKRQWQEDWQMTLVVNDHLIRDTAISQPGFNLPRKIWSTLNKYRTAQGHCMPQKMRLSQQ